MTIAKLLTKRANYHLNPVLCDLRAGGNLSARFSVLTAAWWIRRIHAGLGTKSQANSEIPVAEQWNGKPDVAPGQSDLIKRPNGRFPRHRSDISPRAGGPRSISDLDFPPMDDSHRMVK